MQFFEQARARAEQDHKANPSDAQVLTRWGGALLELAHFKQGPEAVQMIELAVSKFEAALAINPKKHDALWCLGNALTSQGFLFQEAERAGDFFDKAKTCFQRALNEEPTNEIYKKALEMTDKAPGLHAELQRQLAEQQAQRKPRAPRRWAAARAPAMPPDRMRFGTTSGGGCVSRGSRSPGSSCSPGNKPRRRGKHARGHRCER